MCAPGKLTEAGMSMVTLSNGMTPLEYGKSQGLIDDPSRSKVTVTQGQQPRQQQSSGGSKGGNARASLLIRRNNTNTNSSGTGLNI